MADNEKNAYRLDSAPLLPPPQGEGDREAVEGVYLRWKDTPPVTACAVTAPSERGPRVTF